MARLQCEWWLPYRAIINHLFGENYIDKSYKRLYKIDDRDRQSFYCKIFKTLDSEKYDLHKNIELSDSYMAVKNYLYYLTSREKKQNSE